MRATKAHFKKAFKCEKKINLISYSARVSHLTPRGIRRHRRRYSWRDRKKKKKINARIMIMIWFVSPSCPGEERVGGNDICEGRKWEEWCKFMVLS